MVADADLPLEYVVLRHEGVNPPHFDLMFETSAGSELATWQSAIWPVDRRTTLARIADHRRTYLTYEGPLSGNRGWVRRIMSGSCRISRFTPTMWTIDFPDAPLPSLAMLQLETEDQWEVWPQGA